MPDGIYRLLNELELTRLQRLLVNSRYTVEGQLQGAHPSPLKGFSVEFSDYRQYVAGDDLRHLDWRVFGRNERLYIRQYEEECNLRCYLLVDASRSMAYAGGDVPKYRYAARLAAAIAYVTVQQQDSVGLHVFQEPPEATGRPVAPTVCLAPRSGSAHLRQLANALADTEPTGPTRLGDQIHRAAEAIARRALIVIVSDLLDEAMIDDLGVLRQALAHLKRRRHDIVLHQVLDPTELEFPFRDLGNFEDLESGRTLITSPRAIREAYVAAFEDYLRRVKSLAGSLDVDYSLVATDTPLIDYVRAHLRRRQGR